MRIPPLAFIHSAVFLFAGAALAAEPAQKAQGADIAAMMSAMEKSAALSDAHKKLKVFEGAWDVSTTLYVKGQPQPGYSGKADFWSILGDRFVVEDFKGKFLDKPVASHIIFGYDNSKKKYVSVRITSLGTEVMNREGTLSADGKVLTLTGESFDATTNKSAQGRMVYRFESNDKINVEVYETKPGAAEVRLFDMAYTRSAR